MIIPRATPIIRCPLNASAASTTAEEDKVPTKVTIVGSSVVRGVAPLVNGKEFDTVGYCFPGRTAHQINGTFKNIPSSDVTVIAAGTSNIESQTINEITNELKQTIENVAHKRRGKVVLMIEIPPRFDMAHLNEKSPG